MAASDPTPYVATPTGTLQGVAAFSWDGGAWQPSGRAGPDVATSTGVLQGVAPFSWSGSAWTPAGLAQPGVATPTGVLDGVAVYTWSGSAWTPTGGTATPATPSGALRGVAAFSWDGAAWQPAGQARPGVATPYGVLDGVAFFNWGGTTWQAGGAVPSGATLDLSFLSGTLDPRITFTRASTATYFDSSGTMQTAATNAPRFDYDPVTHALRGLLVEEARTNVLPRSSDLTVTWSASSATPTTGIAGAPDGTATVSRIAEVAATASHYVAQNPLLTASTTYTYSVFAKAAETRYLQLSLDNGSGVGGYATFDLQTGTISGPLTALGAGVIGSASIQGIGNGFYRCAISTTIGAFTSGRCLFLLMNTGNPAFAASYAGNAANGLLLWGAQLEQGTFPTSYIPTTAAAVTRAAEAASMPTAAWFSSAAGTLSVESTAPESPPVGVNREFIGIGVDSSNLVRILMGNAQNNLSGQAWAAGANTGTGTDSRVWAAGVPFKSAVTYSTSPLQLYHASGGTVSSSVVLSAVPAFSTLWFGGGGRGSTASAPYRRVRYWPRVLSNAELQSVTT